MSDPRPIADAKRPSNAEVAAAVEAIGRLHHVFGTISGSLVAGKSTARALLDHAHALPGGVPREAAIAIAKLRLEVAHGATLTFDTLRSVVEAIPVPEVKLQGSSASDQRGAADTGDAMPRPLGFGAPVAQPDESHPRPARP